MKQTSSIFLVLVYQFYLGTCQAILTTEATEMSLDLLPEDNIYDTVEDVQNDVTFQLYTRSHPRVYTTLKPTEEADVGDFNSQRETKFIIHGWRSNGDSLANISKGYLESGDYNVIVVDWSKPAASVYLLATYFMNLVGEYLASLIDLLVMRHTLKLEDVHLIGHSLGAHMAGVAGNRIKSGKPGRITGLDPAAPSFCSKPLENRLDPTDGEFVDVIHTCGGLLGWDAPIGHVDFYPNGGTATQPGCNHHSGFKLRNFPSPVVCSHSRSHEYFAESITTSSGFVSYKCPSWNDYKDGKCFQNSRVLMGAFTDINSRGSYYLQTAESSPYALGNVSAVADITQKKVPFYLKRIFLC